MRFLNHYDCPRCNEYWTDEWDCTADDDCPNCGKRHISPTESEDLDDEDTCQHGEHEDCLICAECGKCSETLDDDDTCDDCRTAKAEA